MNELFNALYDKNACNLYKISLEVNVFLMKVPECRERLGVYHLNSCALQQPHYEKGT